jgi:hypothetical protein
MIYVLENAGHSWIFHWFIFMIGALRKIPGSTFPISIYYPLDEKKDNDFHFDTFKIIESKYKYTVPSCESDTQLFSRFCWLRPVELLQTGYASL